MPKGGCFHNAVDHVIPNKLQSGHQAWFLHLFDINRSVVQGSGIGQTLFRMFADNLKPLDILNYLIKNADNATLLSPQRFKQRLNLK